MLKREHLGTHVMAVNDSIFDFSLRCLCEQIGSLGQYSAGVLIITLIRGKVEDVWGRESDMRL